MTLSASVDVSGPLFGPKKPGLQMALNIDRNMMEIAAEGAANARSRYLAGSGGREPVRMLGDRVGDHIIGRTFARPSKGGRRWHEYGVVQVYNEGLSAAQGRSLMAAGSILEGRLNVMRTIAREAGRKLREVDLTKGFGE